MEELNASTTEMVAAAETALRQAAALSVHYSFSIVGAIILLIVGFLLAGAVERWAYAGLGRFRGFDETLRRFFSKVLRYVMLVLVGVTVLAQFGVQTASIIAALGAIGLALGLALQGTLQNIAAGIMLLALRPFRVGEYIITSDIAGTVQEIGLFATELKTFDGLYVLSPNSELWNKHITNTSRNATRMHEIAIGIGYDDDIELARSIYRDLAAKDARILADPAPNTFVSSLGDSAVVVSIRYWTASSDWFSTKLDFTKAAKQAFDASGISIPYPQQEIRYIPPDPDAAQANGAASRKAKAGEKGPAAGARRASQTKSS